MSASNVCQACGAANAPMYAFCVNCGTRLTAANPTPPVAPAPTQPPGYSPGAPSPYPTYPAAYPYYPPPPPRTANFSNILGGSFDVWAKNFPQFFVVYLLLGIVTTLVSSLLSFAAFGTFGPGGGVLPGSPPSGIPAQEAGLLVLYAVAAVVLSVIINSIVTGGMTEYAVRRHRGESLTLEQALRRGVERFPSILGANLLIALIVVALIFAPLLLILSIAGAAGTGTSGTAVAAIFGLFLALIVGAIVAVYVSVAFFLNAPAIMMENANAIDGLSRSWRITKGHFWSLLGAIIVASILVGLITAVFGVPAGLVDRVVASRVPSIIAAVLASAIVGPWLVILAAVAYDLIVRYPRFPAGAVPPYVPGPTMAPPPGAAQVSPGVPPPPRP